MMPKLEYYYGPYEEDPKDLKLDTKAAKRRRGLAVSASKLQDSF